MAAAEASSPPSHWPCVDLDGEEEKAKKQVVEQEVDQFGRLPEEMVLIIVNKLFHLKTLLRFSLVAKRYSSLAFQTHSLFTDFSTLTSPPTGFVGRMRGFLKNLLAKLTSRLGRAAANANANANALTEPDTCLSITQKLSAITHHFQQIKDLHLHFPRDKNNPCPAVKPLGTGLFSCWLATFGSHLEASYFLIAHSVNLTSSTPPNTITYTPAPGSGLSEAFEYRLEAFKTVLGTASEKHVIIRWLASKCKTIETAVFSESRSGGGAFLMGKQQIAKLRATGNLDSAHPAELRVVVYHVPTLELPQTGYTMNDVLFFWAMPGDAELVKVLVGFESDSESEGDQDMADGSGHPDDFDLEKWEVFSEAAALILNDHQNREPMYVFLDPYEQWLPKYY